MQFLQDFISGSILITLVGIMMPDLFPAISFPESLPLPITGSLESGVEDILQVGPPRLMGR